MIRSLILTAALFSAPAFAQDEEEPKVVYKAKTEIDFEGVEVDGELVHGMKRETDGEFERITLAEQRWRIEGIEESSWGGME